MNTDYIKPTGYGIMRKRALNFGFTKKSKSSPSQKVIILLSLILAAALFFSCDTPGSEGPVNTEFTIRSTSFINGGIIGTDHCHDANCFHGGQNLSPPVQLD